MSQNKNLSQRIEREKRKLKLKEGITKFCVICCAKKELGDFVEGVEADEVFPQEAANISDTCDKMDGKCNGTNWGAREI